ncbi:arsenate reductase family protein [Salinimicrobium sp. CAU 1759]
MKKIYHLSTCDTCKRILKELDPPASYELQNIKENPLTTDQLQELKERSGTYEALFNKRARLYKERDLKNKQLSEEDYKVLLLEHYTFLKRPVIVNGQQIFIGNSKKEVAAAKDSISE